MANIRRLYKAEDTVLNTDSYDRERFAQLTELSSKLSELIENQSKNKDFPSLMGDMWASLYKMKPELKELEEGEQFKRAINHQFMERILLDEEFEKMRNATKLDDFSSAIGSMRLSERVIEWIEEEQSKNEALKDLMQQMMNKQQELEHQQKKQENAEERQQEAKENGSQEEQKKADSNAKKEQKKTDKVQNELSDLQQQLQQQFAQSMKANGSGLSQKIAMASNDTKDNKKDLQNLLSGGGAGSGEKEMKSIPLKEQINLAEMLRKNKKLKEIAEWAGKFKSIARKKQKSKHIESLDRSGMTLGDDIERLLPQEIGMLSSKSSRLDFLKRFSEGQTMMYSPKGKETLGKGPIVIVLDQSGSMASLDNQSKGFVLALAMIAKKQRRDFAVIPFSNRVDKTFSYQKGKITPTQLVELATTFLGGGTYYTPALTAARELIENKKIYIKADIVFVTDGEPSDVGLLGRKEWISDFMKFKKESDTNILSLLIGKDVSEMWVRIFSDKIVRASDFDTEESHDILSI